MSLATYVARVAAKAGGEVQQLEADLERLDALAMAASTVVTKEQAAAVDKKLKLCNNVGTAGGDAQARKDKKKVWVLAGVGIPYNVPHRRRARPSGGLRKQSCCKEGVMRSQQTNCSACLIQQQHQLIQDRLFE